MVFQWYWVVPKANIPVGRRYVLRSPRAAHVLPVTRIWWCVWWFHFLRRKYIKNSVMCVAAVSERWYWRQSARVFLVHNRSVLDEHLYTKVNEHQRPPMHLLSNYRPSAIRIDDTCMGIEPRYFSSSLILSNVYQVYYYYITITALFPTYEVVARWAHNFVQP